MREEKNGLRKKSLKKCNQMFSKFDENYKPPGAKINIPQA